LHVQWVCHHCVLGARIGVYRCVVEQGVMWRAAPAATDSALLQPAAVDALQRQRAGGRHALLRALRGR
jgi:hypothetical protein